MVELIDSLDDQPLEECSCTETVLLRSRREPSPRGVTESERVLVGMQTSTSAETGTLRRSHGSSRK
jgi:hypothetical protein